MRRPPLALIPTTAIAGLLLFSLSTLTPAVSAGEFDLGHQCGKLNGGGYTGQYMCSGDRKSVVSSPPHPPPPCARRQPTTAFPGEDTRSNDSSADARAPVQLVCQATVEAVLLPIWQLDRHCHADHFCYALQGASPDSEFGNAPMEPNGLPSDDPQGFGCRKLLGIEDQGESQTVMDGEGLRKRSMRTFRA